MNVLSPVFPLLVRCARRQPRIKIRRNGGRWLAVALTLLAGGPLAVEAAEIALPALGEVRPRAAKEIASSTWSVGAETLDRDYAIYRNYRDYLGPLGAKHLRVQTGWAKCERERGVYSWDWLDEVVDDALAQGVQPWLEIGYGNRLYEGGGGPGLGDGLPSSPEGLEAWDRWVKALVMRYKDRVRAWEIWNEPDLVSPSAPTPDAYAGLFLRTASMVRALQPESRIIALAMVGNADYADQFLAAVQAKGRLDLVDVITIHGYPRNPDDTTNIDRLTAVIAKYGRAIEVRQGETGAPSQRQHHFALRDISWTENLQAKWNLRRMLAHRARDVAFNLFTLSDLHYTYYHREPGTALRMNYKGLLATNPDRTIARPKVAYRAAQNVFAIFDDTLKRIADFPFTTTALRGLAVHGYEQPGAQVVAFWFNDAPPAEANGVTLIDLALPKARFTEPVLVDLLTGRVHVLPPESWKQAAEGMSFVNLPVYDAPLLLAERSVLRLDPAKP